MKIPAFRFDKRPDAMPRWATLERDYLRLASTAPEMLKDYLTEDGEIIWPDCAPGFQTFAYGNVDNVFEGFQSFPLLYLLGGDASLLDYSKKEYAAFVRQFSSKVKTRNNLATPDEVPEANDRNTMLVDGIFPDLDWMHTGEASMFLYHLLLADPKDENSRKALLTLAQYHFGENPAGFERNYDPVNRVFKSGYFGANGPAWSRFGKPIMHSHWMDFYGLAFYDVPGVTTYLDLDDPEKAAIYGEIYGRRLSHCDTVTNMMSTSAAVNAYMLTGDESYRKFVIDYVRGWRERRGTYEVMPDNAGPHGIVGETLGGRFYGSHYGWTHPHGYYFVEDALIVGGENERLLTGRADALDWARELYNTLIDRYGIPREGGGVLFPQKHADEDSVIEFIGNEKTPMTRPDRVTDAPGLVRYKQVNGWYEYGAPEASHWGHIYAASNSEADIDRIEQIMPPEKLKVSMKNLAKKYKGGQHLGFARYLAGRYPEYPEDILAHSIDVFYKQAAELDREKSGASAGLGYEPDGEGEWQLLRDITAEVREKTGIPFDESIIHSYYQTFLLYRTPLSVEGLLNLTMGAMAPVYNGGMIQAQLRYFDADANRPGLPEGVSALISAIRDDGITLTLANTDPYYAHTLIMQGGAYGEHRLDSVTVDGETSEIGDKWATVTLAPGAVQTMDIAMTRFANAPSLEEPI